MGHHFGHQGHLGQPHGQQLERSKDCRNSEVWHGLMRFGGYFFRIHPEQYRAGESAHNLHPKKHQRKIPGVLNLDVALGTPKELPKKIHQSGFKWRFQTFFIFNPAWGNDPIWLVFSRGLKPPQFFQKKWPTSWLKKVGGTKIPQVGWSDCTSFSWLPDRILKEGWWFP